jgi:hypothetical protein
MNVPAPLDLAAQRERSFATMRAPQPHEADAVQLARALRQRFERIWLEGTVWGPGRVGALHGLRGTRAWKLFGEPALTAAATRTVHACCTFGLARLWAARLGEPAPRVSPALITLLGEPCASCVAEIAAEKAAQDDAVGREQPPRPAASTSALIASATDFRAGGPSSPDGWTVKVARQPTEDEDRAFLTQMARQDAARRRHR